MPSDLRLSGEGARLSDVAVVRLGSSSGPARQPRHAPPPADPIQVSLHAQLIARGVTNRCDLALERRSPARRAISGVVRSVLSPAGCRSASAMFAGLAADAGSRASEINLAVWRRMDEPQVDGENVVNIRGEPDIYGSMGHAANTDGRRRFACLYEAHRLHVLACCVRRTNRSDAADACSETFLVAWRRLDDLPAEPGTLRTCTASLTRCSATSFARSSDAPASTPSFASSAWPTRWTLECWCC